MSKFGKKKQTGEVNDDFPDEGGVLAEAQEHSKEDDKTEDKPLME